MTSAKHAGGAGPWDALLLTARQTRVHMNLTDIGAKPATKLSGLLEELAARRDATTLTLSVCADLTPRQVWGLLKEPRACGQVRFAAGRWQLVADFMGRDVARAAALLRTRGWRLEPPSHNSD